MRDGVQLTFESGRAGAFEDGMSACWTAEALRNGFPVAEGQGETPLDAVMALAQALTNLVNGQAIDQALDQVETAQVDALAAMDPAARAAYDASKQRLAERRAAAASQDQPE